MTYSETSDEDRHGILALLGGRLTSPGCPNWRHNSDILTIFLYVQFKSGTLLAVFSDVRLDNWRLQLRSDDVVLAFGRHDTAQNSHYVERSKDLHIEMKLTTRCLKLCRDN